MGKAIMNSKSYMSDQDLINLIEQYSRHFFQIFKGKGYFVWFDEIKGRLTVICFEARNNYRSNRNHTASMRTYIIGAFKKRIALPLFSDKQRKCSDQARILYF